MNINNSSKSFQANHWSRYIFQRGLINQLENKPSFFVFHGPGSQGNLPKEGDKQEQTAGKPAETTQSTYALNKKDIGSSCAHESKMSFQLISNKSFLNLLLKIEQSFCFLGIFHGPTLVSPFSFSTSKNTKSSKPHFFCKSAQKDSQDWFTSFQEKRIFLGWVDLPFFWHNLEVSTIVVLPSLVDQQISCLQKKFISAA
jgi:hypothetical protein